MRSGRCDGNWPDMCAGPQSLHATHDHTIAGMQPFFDQPLIALPAGRFDIADGDRIAFPQHIDKRTRRSLLHSPLGNEDHIGFDGAFKTHLHELSRHEDAIGIGKGDARVS